MRYYELDSKYYVTPAGVRLQGGVHKRVADRALIVWNIAPGTLAISGAARQPEYCSTVCSTDIPNDHFDLDFLPCPDGDPYWH